MSFVFGYDENGIICDDSSEFKIVRAEKGKSIIDFPTDYVVVDLETTGLEPSFDEIIEVGVIRVHNGEVIDSFQSLVKPRYKIDDYITRLTGITNEMLSSAPHPKEILPKFIDFIGDNVIVGHNVNFDINFLYDYNLRLFNKPVSNNFIDTMRIARKQYPDFKHHRLKDLIKVFNIPSNGSHRSLNDCYNTYYCYLHMQKDIIKQFGDLNNFIELFKKKYKNHKKYLDARTLSTDKTEFDISHPLYGKLCAFTGTLEKMQRKDAMQKVLDFGGKVGNGVTSKTNYLILGNNDYCSTIKDGKSNKQKKAEELKLQGNDIEIINENVFYDMLSE